MLLFSAGAVAPEASGDGAGTAGAASEKASVGIVAAAADAEAASTKEGAGGDADVEAEPFSVISVSGLAAATPVVSSDIGNKCSLNAVSVALFSPTRRFDYECV